MTCMKKLTALLVSAALALSLLAGCGGSKALSQVIADLLSGMYNNVTVEVDPDLTAALKKASAAGSTREEVLAALVEELNLSGVRLTLRQLQEGQQGDRGVELVFQSGTDPDAAARSAVNGWASAFGALPDDGSYTAHVSMIEAEGGYYIAVDVEVLKAGTPDKDEPDEPDQPDEPYTKNKDGSYTVNTSDGLQKLFNDESKTFDGNTVIELKTDTTYTVDAGAEHLADTFKGTLKSADEKNKASVTLSGTAGLFGTLEDGKVENLSVTVTNNINTGTTDNASNTCVGAVANINKGQITGCEVTINSGISSSNEAGKNALVGGVVGYNTDGNITGCSSTGTVTGDYAGGVVGYNSATVTACYATGDVTGNTSAGGVVGYNASGTVTACYATGTVSGDGAGGVVGYNASGTVTACYATGKVESDYAAGGVVGYNYPTTITACYWSGSQTQGIGGGNQATDPEYSPSGNNGEIPPKNKVPDGTTWSAATTAMNDAIPDATGWWYVPNGDSAPTKFTQTKPVPSTTP